MQLGMNCWNGISCARELYKQEGLFGFYKGVSASYFGVIETSIQFVLYEQIKKWIASQKFKDNSHKSGFLIFFFSSFFAENSRQKKKKGNLLAWEYFAGASVAKMSATVVTYPYQVVRTRLREQSKGEVKVYANMVDCFFKVARQEGRRGLFGGLAAHLLRVVPNSAIHFMVYELSVNYFKS